MTKWIAIALVAAVALTGCEDEHCHGECSHEDAGTTTADAATDPVAEYCNCMLVNCHEPFHDRWGESDMEAIANCTAEAGALPRAGSMVDTGNSLECRAVHCDRAAANAATECPAALGDTICM